MTRQGSRVAAVVGVAEADGNRTRQGQSLPLTGFEDRGTHQASVRLRGEGGYLRHVLEAIRPRIAELQPEVRGVTANSRSPVP